MESEGSNIEFEKSLKIKKCVWICLKSFQKISIFQFLGNCVSYRADQLICVKAFLRTLNIQTDMQTEAASQSHGM